MSRRVPALRPARAWLLALATLGATGLAACRDEPVGAPAPASPLPNGPDTPALAGGGAYRLTISGIGSTDESSAVVVDARPAAGAAMVAPGDRGLTPRPSGTYPLQLQRVVNGSFAVGTRGDPSAYRYVFAVFRVRNGSGAALTNLSLLAIGTPSTLGGSAISNLTRADGATPAGAAAIAAAMLPAGASGLGRTGTLTALRTDALQVYPEADIAGAGIPSPYAPLAYGFTVLDTVTDGRAIATSAAGNYPGLVLFAFKVPLQATAAEDVFTFSFNFFAVTDAETRVTQSLEERDAASTAAVSARASALGATAIHLLRGSTLAGLSTARTFCSVRTAGSQASPAAFLGATCPDQITGSSTTPSPVTVAVGGTQQLTASVTLGGGAALLPAVAYASANPAIATVSATGLVTGVAAGTTTIYVAPYASSTLLQAIPVTVSASPTLTLSSLTTFTNVPINTANASGNIVPTLAVRPVGSRVTRLEVSLGGTLVCQQTYAEITADQSVACPFLTTTFDAVTGVPRFANGTWSLTARVYGYASPGATSVTELAAITPVPLTLANSSGLYVRATNALPGGDSRATVNATGQAVGADGRTWLAGNLLVTVLPIRFDAGAPDPLQSVTVTLTDAKLPGGSATLSGPASGGSATITFPGASATAPAGGNTVTGFTSTPAGTTIGVTPVGGGAGSTVLTLAGTPLVGPLAVNVDNQIPEPRTITIPASFTQGGLGTVGFLGASFSFADSLAVTAATTTNGDYAGVDRVSFAYYAGPSGGSEGTIVSTGTRAATGADLAPLAGTAGTNSALRAVAVLTDALGNSRSTSVLNTAGSGNFTFGVDLVSPVITTAPSSTITRRGGGFVSNFTYAIGISDDLSGFDTQALVGRITRQDPTFGLRCVTSVTTSNFTTLVDASSTTTPTASIGSCPLVLMGPTFGVATGAPRGEYRFDFAARDAAHNVGAFQTRRFVLDPGVPTVGGISVPASLGGNQVVTFVSSATDDFDLQSAYGLVAFGGSGLVFRYDGPTLGASYDNVFTASAPITITTTNGFIRQIQQGTLTQSAGVGATTGSVFGAGTGLIAASHLGVMAIDAGNNRALNQVPIPTGNLGTMPGNLGTGSAAAVDSVQLRLVDPSSNPSGTIVGGVVTDTLSTTGTSGAPDPISVTVRFDVFGPVGTFVTPFQRVELWTIAPNGFFGGNAVASGAIYNPSQPLAFPFTNTAYRFFQSFPGGPAVADVVTARRVRYSTTVTAASLDPGTNGSASATFVVVAVTPNGDAVISAPIGIVVNNP